MASIVVPTPIVLTPAQSYSSEEWEQKRSIITQLYRDEAKSLSHVRAILAQQHAFRPTVAMLKNRFKKWDLDRNHKQADMLCALRLAFQREAQGKKTVFLIRGRVVTFHNVKQYFRRKGAHDLQLLMTGASTAAPTTRIDCRTPEPGATAGDNAIYDAESPIAAKDLSLHHANPTIMALPDPDQVGHMMTPTETLSQLDQLLHLGWNYYDSVFENPDWRSKDNMFELRSLEMFYHHMFDGQSLLERSHVTEAFEHFSRAFDLIHHLLSQQTFLFLPYLYHMMLPTRQIRQQEVFSQLLDFISRMAQKCYPQLDPIQRSLTLLRHMSVEDRGESSKRAFQSILNRVRVEFEADIPDEFELLSSVICQERANLTLEQSLGNYKLTSVAVSKLAKDAELLELLPGHKHTLAAKLTITHGDEVFGRHGDLKPQNILILYDEASEKLPRGILPKIVDFGIMSSSRFPIENPSGQSCYHDEELDNKNKTLSRD